MSKHEIVAVLEAQMLSPIAFLKANHLFLPRWHVMSHKATMTLRYAWQETDIVVLAFVTGIAMLAAGAVATLATTILSVLSDSASFGMWCEIFATLTTSLVGIAAWFIPIFPRWHETDVTSEDRFKLGHVSPDLPEQAKNIRDLIAFAYPGASFEVEAFAGDPIMWARISGERRRHAVCIWDYKDREAVMLHPV